MSSNRSEESPRELWSRIRDVLYAIEDQDTAEAAIRDHLYAGESLMEFLSALEYEMTWTKLGEAYRHVHGPDPRRAAPLSVLRSVAAFTRKVVVDPEEPDVYDPLDRAKLLRSGGARPNLGNLDHPDPGQVAYERAKAELRRRLLHQASVKNQKTTRKRKN